MPQGWCILFVTIGELSFVLSIMGSSFITYLIVMEKRKWKGFVFERLMLGLSVSDLISTWGMLLQPYFIPSSTGLLFIFGNEKTCRIAGFLGTFAGLSYLYSCALVVHLYVTVGKTNSRSYLSYWYLEILLHTCFWVWGTLYSLFTLMNNLIKPSTFLGTCLQDLSIFIHLTNRSALTRNTCTEKKSLLLPTGPALLSIVSSQYSSSADCRYCSREVFHNWCL